MPDLEKLRKLADHLANGKLGHDRFSFSILNAGIWENERKINLYHTSDRLKGCGTVGCAIGELPFIFDEWSFRLGTPVYKDFIGHRHSVVVFFNLSDSATSHLFYPNNFNIRIGGKELNENATKDDVANNILHFIKRCEDSFEFSYTYSDKFNFLFHKKV